MDFRSTVSLIVLFCAVQLAPSSRPTRETLWLLHLLWWSRQPPEIKSQWTTWQISLSRRLFISTKVDPMKKVATDHQVCQLTRVFIQHTSTCIEPRFTSGADAVTLKLVHFAMANANGWLLGADPSISMCLRVATTSSATARWVRMPRSATERIST
jgi:hypothetical protein